jgi:hypothetical protein
MNEIRNETMRQLIDLAIRSGRKKQSAQTGYIHYCHQVAEDEKHDSIPIYENLLFALALLRSRTSENVLEAKTLIEGLLHFQLHDGIYAGNFPKYLHEYPNCNQRLLGASLLPSLYWIHKSFHHILGNELKQRLEETLLTLTQYSLQTLQEKPAPYTLTLKIAASSKAVGHLLNLKSLEDQGSHLLSELLPKTNSNAFFCPAELADCVIALQMVYPVISNSPWEHLWKHLALTWHQPTGNYIGPSLKEFQCGSESEPTQYDLLMGYLTKSLSQRSLGDQLFHLQAALIQPTEDHLLPPQYPVTYNGDINGHAWQIFKTHQYAYSCFATEEISNPTEKGLHPLRLIWGNADRLHTFVCQGGNSQSVKFETVEDGLDLLFTLDTPLPQDDKEKSREIGFYFDAHQEIQFSTLDLPTNTFQIGDKLQLAFPGINLEMQFTIEDGEGREGGKVREGSEGTIERFFGHIMPGNRPSQLSIKGNHSHHCPAYDWQVFLRTLERKGQCLVRVKIRFEAMNGERKEAG